MPIPITVNGGDCMASIAQTHGFADYAKVHRDPLNTELSKKRKNPNVLAKGDIVWIPDPNPKSAAGVICIVNEFTLVWVPTHLSLTLVDPLGNGLEGKYELNVGNTKRNGTVGPGGKIDEPIPASETHGTLRLWPKGAEGTDGYLLSLDIGYLEPASVDDGCYARLTNLGYDCSDADARKEAVRAYKSKTGGNPDAILDDSTRETLRREHEGEP
jgi:hypothetical protein